MFKRHTITLLAIMSVAISAFAIAEMDNPDGVNLEDNEEYQQLLIEREQLMIKEDSVRHLLSDTRAEMRNYLDTLTTAPSRQYIDSCSSRIVKLEEEIFNITAAQGVVASRINDIELDALQDQFTKSIFSRLDSGSTDAKESAEDDNAEAETPIAEDNAIGEETTETAEEVEESEETTSEVEEVYATDDRIVEEQGDSAESTSAPRRNIIDNECFVNALAHKDLLDLRAAQHAEAEVGALCDEYVKYYELLNDIDTEYNNATEQISADSIYGVYAATLGTLDSLNAEISHKWNQVIDTKYYAYGYVLEKERNMELLAELDSDFTSMLQQCAANDNMYASNGVMRYAIGRPAIVDFEHTMASSLGITEACDSIGEVRRTMSLPTYQMSLVALPEHRLFLDYADITFGRTNYYNDANPLPTLKVYERGTIYRILLGVFKSRQPMTLFKGVQPLYIERDGRGMNHYYAGGFATLEEAEMAQRMLRDKGFKAPEICVWMDGMMTNLTADSGMSANEEEATEAKRYMLRIAEADMTDEIRQYISEQYPDKMTTLTSDGIIIGSFDGHDEVTRLFIVLGDEYGVDSEILEVEIN